MAEPFTPARVARFLILVALALLVVTLLTWALFHTRPRKSITPSQPSASSFSLPAVFPSPPAKEILHT